MNMAVLLYGATGFTGRLIVEKARSQGLPLTLAGRDPAAIAALAAGCALPGRVGALEDPAALDRLLAGMAVVLHAAGPFSATSRPMLDACLRNRVHYLDITGEIAVFEACAARDQAAKAAGIMVMPGVGFDVVPSDCLCAHVAARLAEPTRLSLFIKGLGDVSRGTARTMIEGLGHGTAVRRDGRIVELPEIPRGCADFGAGPEPVVGLGWGDVSTAYHSTGIPDVAVFFRTSRQLERLMGLPGAVRRALGSGLGQRLLKRLVALGPSGPGAAARAAGRAILLAEAHNGRGEVARARLTTGDPYALTAETALIIAAKVLAGLAPAGFQTPSRAYGADLILLAPGCRREDL